MATYIEKFRSGLREVQSKQVLSLLSKEKDRGSITSVQEFRDRLQEVTAQLQSQQLTPTLTLFLASFQDLIDSESYNFMLERIEDDLSAAYQEMNSIDEVLEAHETIINNVVLQNLELAVNELESKIESFEFLNKNREGFDNAIFNTFRVTQNNRTTATRQVLFTDPKTGASSSGQFEAQIDPIGEKLLLQPSISEEYTPAGIRQVFDYEATGSELDVEFDDSNINNIIDRAIGTFWVQSTLLSQPKDEGGVVTKLEIDLGTVRSVNFIQIEPLVLYPVEVIGITIIDPNNQPITILSEAVEIKSNNKLYFNTASAKRIIIKFRNRNYSIVQFQTRPGSPFPEITRDLSNLDQSVQNISDDLQELVSSPTLQASLGVQAFTREDKSYYEYLLGLDNIRIGLGTFNDTSIFVSASERVNTMGQVALQVTEKRPIGDIDSADIEYTLDTYPLGTDDYFHGSLEYFMLKRDFSDADALLDLQLFPVLPLGVTGIRHERLFLTEKSNVSLSTEDIGFLQFFTLNNPYHADDAPSGTIRVYRNGRLLPNGDASTGPAAAVESDAWEYEGDASQNTPGQPLPMKYAIKIQNPSPSHIYTVSYTPAISTTNTIPPEANPAVYLAEQGLRLVDLTGNLKAWLGNDNIVYFKETQSGAPVAYSTVNLVVVLRRNSANLNLTPILEDYLIATGSRNAQKFGG